MRFFVIGDEDTVLGFSYAGVEGRVVHTPEEARDALRNAMTSGNVGIIVLNDYVAESIREEVSEIRLEGSIPVIVEIPGMAGPLPDRTSLEKLIRQAIGIRV
ncbi:MAG TPA: V-type ATP synthase subunit F [Candidatus Brocadiia bacterium]|nr:V-type ATP synthase subunit F [Candidatus Brocadiia bacterium]